MSEPMSGALEPGHTAHAPTPSYCCECGTYDAHDSICTCCGFDFRGDAPKEEDEIE